MSAATCVNRSSPTKERVTSLIRVKAAWVGMIWLPWRSNSSKRVAASKSRINRLTAGCVTDMSSAAAVMLPVVMTARKASTCLKFIERLHNIGLCTRRF